MMGNGLNMQNKLKVPTTTELETDNKFCVMDIYVLFFLGGGWGGVRLISSCE